MTQSITQAFCAGIDCVLDELVTPDPDCPIGISSDLIRVLRKNTLWNADDRMRAEGALSELLNVCNHRAGLPQIELPAEFIACMIARIVSPVNRVVAAQKAPRGYKGILATGLHSEPLIEDVEPETMIALVIAFSGGYEVPEKYDSVEETMMKQQQEDKEAA